MAATYPTNVKNFGSDHVNGDVIVPSDVNDLRAEVAAVQALNAYQISPSIASNNLTLAIKTLSGNNASAAEPIVFIIAGVGHTLTAALSVTVNAGTNIFNAGAAELMTNDIDFFVYIGWRAASSTLFVIISRIPYARTYADFSVTSTNEKYGAYSGSAPASTDVVRVIGRFAARNSGAASFNWSIPSAFVVHEPIFETRVLNWVPQWTNLTVGNGTQTAKYQIKDETLEFHQEVVFGSTSAISGDISHTLPISRATHYAGAIAGGLPGTAVLRDNGVSQYPANPTFTSTTTISVRAQLASGTYVSNALCSSTVPFTWGTSDEVYEWVRYFII